MDKDTKEFFIKEYVTLRGGMENITENEKNALMEVAAQKIKLLKGLHITAGEKRNILTMIDYGNKDKKYFGKYYSLKRKSYNVQPKGNGEYTVKIRANESGDYGKSFSREDTRLIKVG